MCSVLCVLLTFCGCKSFLGENLWQIYESHGEKVQWEMSNRYFMASAWHGKPQKLEPLSAMGDGTIFPRELYTHVTYNIAPSRRFPPLCLDLSFASDYVYHTNKYCNCMAADGKCKNKSIILFKKNKTN